MSNIPDSNLDNSDSLTVLEAVSGYHLAKRQTYTPEGGWVTFGFDNKKAGKAFRYKSVPVTSVETLTEQAEFAAQVPSSIVIRGEVNAVGAAQLAETGSVYRRKTHFSEAPRRWVMLDFDKAFLPGYNIRHQGPEMIAEFVRTQMPPEFQDVRIGWQLSSSAGVKNVENVRVHLWCWLSRPVSDAELKAWMLQSGMDEDTVDHRLFNSVQMHYVADPSFEGAPDPCGKRWGMLPGNKGEVEVPAIDLQAAFEMARSNGGSSEVLHGTVEEILARMGDDKSKNQKGFHYPTRDAMKQYVRSTPKAERDFPAIKARMREVALKAPKDASRNNWEEYVSDARLDADIKRLLRREAEREKQAAAEFGEQLSLEQCSLQLRKEIGAFFDEIWRPHAH